MDDYLDELLESNEHTRAPWGDEGDEAGVDDSYDM